MTKTETETAVYAAGGVVWRHVEGKLRVLLIHRTKYRDLTLPKGKVDPGETLAETAVREIREETGIRVSLGVPVGVSRYRMPSSRTKIVHYWAAEATDAAVRSSTFVPNKEVAAIEWVSLKKARKNLSYPVDIEILDEFTRIVDEGALPTFPIVVLRHGKARPREEWQGSDSARPLTPRGRRQAEAIVGPLLAFGVRRVYSSPAERCVRTATPLAQALGQRINLTEAVSQDAWEQGRADARSLIGERVRAGSRWSCRAIGRCCPTSCTSSRSRPGPWAGRISEAPRRSSPRRSRSCTFRSSTPAPASWPSRRTIPKV